MRSLVVDDDVSIRAFIRTVLERERFETIEAEGGTQALEIVDRFAGRLDLIVTDIQMPQGDGLTFARAVRKRFPSIPIVLVSGYAAPDAAFPFLEKPFTWAELAALVRRLAAAA